MAMNPATQIRSLKRDLKDMREARLVAKNTLNGYRVRATKAEHEAAEWKKRFDALLEKLPDRPKETP